MGYWVWKAASTDIHHHHHHLHPFWGIAMSGRRQPPNVIPSTPRRGVLRQMRKQWSAYLFLAPTMILFGIFTVLAVIYVLSQLP